MRILVTGVDGYLGSLLAPVLADRGHAVTGLDTGFFRATWLHTAPVWSPATISADIRELTPSSLDGFDAVVHMGELSNDPLGALDPTLTEEINYEGSVNLARLAKRAGVTRFVYMSSCSVYGAAEGIVDERSPLRPQTAYARCKAKVETALQELADSSFQAVCLRNATAFGASPRLRLDLVVNDLCAQAQVFGRLELTSDGTPWRPLVHGRDIAGAIVACLEAPAAAVAGAVLNVGDEANNVRIRDIARMVGEAFGEIPVRLGQPGGDARSYAVDFSLIRSTLPGFTCRWSVARGILDLRDVLAANRIGPDDLTGPRFNRLRTLQQLMAGGLVDDRLRWRRPTVDLQIPAATGASLAAL